MHRGLLLIILHSRGTSINRLRIVRAAKRACACGGVLESDRMEAPRRSGYALAETWTKPRLGLPSVKSK